jgi:molecular chaperone DnaK (HSP70)
MSDWILAIDFGTSFTTAAFREDGRAELVKMSSPEGAFRDVMPSSVFLPCEAEPEPDLAGDGAVAALPEERLVVGWTAEHQAAIAPDRFEPTPKRRLGAEQHLVLGGEPLGVAGAVARVLGHVLKEARWIRGGSDPFIVALTHPASWAQGRVDALVEAAYAAGIENPRLLSEPEAAALHFAERVQIGELVAVYDLGGGTFDAAVLQRTGDTRFDSVARPGGQDGLGGEEFDRRLYEYVANELAEEDPQRWADIRARPRAHRDFRMEVRRAKEALSGSPTHDLYLPGEQGRPSYRVTVEEFDELIRPDIDASVEILRRTLAEAGIDDPSDSSRLAGIYLAGGSSRIPLVAQVIGERLNRVPQTLGEPKTAVALGATAVIHAPPRAEPGAGARRREPARGRPTVEGSDAQEEAALASELAKWNWGAFLLGPIWGLPHGILRSLLTILPIYGIYELIMLGRHGNRMAWKTRKWQNVESFHESQRTWATWAFVAWVIITLVVIAGSGA